MISYENNNNLLYYNKFSYHKNGSFNTVENYSASNVLNSKTIFDNQGREDLSEQYLNGKLIAKEEYDKGLKQKTTSYNRNGKIEQTQKYIYNDQGVLLKIQIFSASGKLLDEQEKNEY